MTLAGSGARTTGRRVGGVIPAAAILLLALAGCQGMPERRQYEFQGGAMGTSYHVKVVAAELSDERVASLRSLVESELAAVDKRMSTYLDASELNQINQAAGGETVSVSPEMLEVLVAARQIGSATRGAFDITVGPLVDAWGFGPQGRPERIPTDEELERLSRLTGWNRLAIDDAAGTVTKSASEVRCDLSGIAKGYGVDRVSDGLGELGYANHMVEVGGEVRVSGLNRTGAPWRIAVERPEASRREYHKVLALTDMALATSGDYRNYYEEQGIRYSHIIDPRNRKPIRHRLASVSVADQVCMIADGYATALLVLGEEEGYEVAVKENLAALFLIRAADGSYTEKATPRFTALLGDASATEEGDDQ